MENKCTLKGKCSSKQKGGEMDVSDVILGVQGGKPYEYAYYEDNDDYDYEAAERDGAVAGEDGHMSDRYKKSDHPTYSTESTEHAGQYLGGKWVYPDDASWRYDNGNPVFVPSEFNKEVIWERYHMSPEAFYAMYSDVTRDKVLLPEFQMAGENNVPTYHSPDPAIVAGKYRFGSPGWWGSKVAPWMDKAALVTGFVPIVGDAASLLFDVGANFARYQQDKNDPTIPESQRKDIAKANLKSGLGLAGIGALLGLVGTSVPSGAARKMLTNVNKRAINSPLERVYNRFGYYKDIPDNVTVLKKAANDDPRSYRQILNSTDAYDQLTPGNKLESNFITFRNTPGELTHHSAVPVDIYHPEYHSFRDALNRGDVDFLNKKFPIVRDNVIEWQYKNGLYKPSLYDNASLYGVMKSWDNDANKFYRRFLYDAKDSGFDIADLSKVAQNDSRVMWTYPKLLSYNKDAANNLLKDEINSLLYPQKITNNWNGKSFFENYVDDFAQQIIRRKNRRKAIAGSVFGGMALSMPALADLYETIPNSMNDYTSRFDYTNPQQYPYLYSKFNNAVARNVFPDWMFDQKNRLDMLPRYTALLENGIISQEKFDEKFKPASYETNNGYNGFVDTSKGLWNGFVNLSNSPLSNKSGEFLFNTYVPRNNEENKWTGNKEYFSNRSDIKDDDFVYLKDGRLYVSPLDSVPADSTQIAHFPLQIKNPIDSFELDNNGRLRLRMKSGELYNPAAVNENWNNRKVIIGTRDGSSTVMGANLFNQIFEQNAIDSLNSLYKDKDIRIFVPDNGAYNGDRLFNGHHAMPSEQAFNIYLDKYALGGPIRRFQGGKESKVPLNTPYVFSEKAPEGYYPTVENEEGMYSPLVVEPTVTVQASPAQYSKGWYALRPNKYNPYLPLEQQSKEAQADYIAQNTREATAKAAPYVAGTLLATAALPYAVSSGIGLAKGVGDFGSFLATTAGRQAAANTGKRLLFDTALGMGAWNASNDVSQDITGKSLDSHISEGMQYMGVPEGVADVASSFINPFGYLGAGAMEGAAKSLPYMIDRTKNVLSKTWNNPDSKFLQNVFPSRAIKLLDKEYDNTNELYNSIAETQKNAKEKLHELDESLRYKTANLESDEERGILFKQLYHADSGRNLKFEEQVPIEKHFKGSKEEPLSYTDLNGNEIKANAVLRTGNGELKTDNNILYVKDGKIQNENINTITTTDDRMNYFEPSSNDVQKAIYNDYQKISSDMGDSGVVGGSYALYSHGITGSPHDLEVYTTQSKLKNLEKSLGLNHTTTGAMVENYTSKYAENNPAHNVQVCIIDGNGKTSWGHNAESIYASLHPEEYFKLRESYSFNKLGKRITGDMKIEIPMSPDQLLQEMKNNPDALVKKVFIDNIVSGKGKHAQRIYEAALSQPKLINECISTINKSMFGRDFQISELYPSIDLTDIEANKELLNLIGYDEKYATNPEVMESVFRLFDTEATWGTAGAKEISDKRWGNQIMNSATSKHNGAGAGANMARSPIGGGEQYAYEGLMTIRRFLLSHESNKINNVSDYLKQLKRLNAASEEPVSNILTTKQIETFNHFMTKHNMPNYIGTLTKDNTAQQMFVKINNIQSELNNKFGDFDAASNELMNLYKELDLPFLYDASERTTYRSTRHIGLNKDILSGGYFGGLSRPIAYGTKNSALYRPSARLEGSQLRMENAHVYDVMDIFNPKTSTSSYGDMQLDDQLKSILEKKIKNAEDAVRKDYTQLLNKDLRIYPYYMTQDVLPSQKAREIGKTIENEYIPLELESRDLRKQLTSLSDKLQDIHDRRFVLGFNRDSNKSALGYVSGVSFGAAALIGGIYGLINYIDKDSKEIAQRSQKVVEQENKWLKHLGVPFENIRDVRTELNAGYTKYNEGRLRGKWKPFPEWAEENSDLVNDILTKYRK